MNYTVIQDGNVSYLSVDDQGYIASSETMYTRIHGSMAAIGHVWEAETDDDATELFDSTNYSYVVEGRVSALDLSLTANA